MMQTVNDATFQTLVFEVLLAIAFFAFLRRRQEPLGFTHEVTSELKGFAILTIIFGHIGYFLFTDHNFLFPLSTISGVGVDIFFLLSGFGLAISALKKNYHPWEFYKRRIGKIFVPLWVVLVVFLVLDAILLRQFYDWPVLLRSFLGLFPSADIYKDFNSPLWYLTPLLFYYLIFPWVFKPRYGIGSAVIMLVIGYVLQLLPLPVTEGVRNLYSLHFIAFPLGVALAASSHGLADRGRGILEWMRERKVLRLFRYSFLVLLGLVFWFTATTGGSGLVAQLFSVICACAVLLIFISVKLRFRLLAWFGDCSYEIYLVHWLLLYRYDFIYHWLPAGVGTALYFVYLLGLAYLLKRICARM